MSLICNFRVRKYLSNKVKLRSLVNGINLREREGENGRGRDGEGERKSVREKGASASAR